MSWKPTTRTFRRISQILFLIVFLILFRLTDYTGEDAIPYAVNIFFRWDPLVAASVMLAARQFIMLLLPALAVILLTVVFGRVFCGWICPLGTILDGADKIIRTRRHPRRDLRWIKYVLLVVILVGSVFQLQLIGFLDPFSLLVRGMTFSVDPVFNWTVTGIFDNIYLHAPSWISGLTEPVYDVLKSSVLPYRQSFFFLSTLSFLVLLTILFLERYGKRFWCRNLCPLGGMLAVVARFSPFRRKPDRSCKDCPACASFCRMNAFDRDTGLLHHEECTLCMDCIDDCENQQPAFRFTMRRNETGMDMTRRAFIGAGVAGVTLPLLSKVNASPKVPAADLLRPPGAAGEEADFMALCVRCGECMKVCIQNALQPCFMESGYEGMFTPRLVPRLGYCEFNCTLCGQVCPTGAIQLLTLKEKHAFVIGIAVFDQDRCLPFAKDIPCIVCEEHCPTFDKAIKFREVDVTRVDGTVVRLKQPYVVDELCIGCGICEAKCPLPGDSAIRVFTSRITQGEADDGYGSGY